MAVGVAVVVLLAGYGAYAYLTSSPGTLVIYTYSSLFGGSCGSPVFGEVFGPFERVHNLHVQVECPSGTLVSTLVSQRNSPGADVVIGLDEITAPQAAAQGLLLPYTPSSLRDVPSSLVRELGANHTVTPYEFGYLAIDYTSQFAAQTHGAVSNSSFLDFAQNSTWAKNLLVENPTTDIVGEELLLWQIEFYTQVLHQDWRNFWTSADHFLPTSPDWSSAFASFNASASSPQAVVSYSTDPAYAANAGTPGSLNATFSSWQGQAYGWKTVYGLGVVNGTKHAGLAQAFVDWFLSGTVQSQIPLNEWEYPANSSVALPPVFRYAVDPSTIQSLNDATTSASIIQELPGWLNEWQSLENQYG